MQIKEFLTKHIDLLKKLGAAVLTAAVAYFVLAYLIPNLLSVKVVSLAGALGLGYLVYTKVALWEIERVIKGAQDAADKVVDTVKKV